MRLEAMATMALALGVAVGGCERTRMGAGEDPAEVVTTGEESADDTRQQATTGRRCPMTVPQTNVEYSPLDDGGALVFTTREPGNVADLQRGVEGLAETHREHGRRMGEPGPMGRGESQGMGPGETDDMGPTETEPAGPGDTDDMGSEAGDMSGHDHPAAGKGPGLQGAPAFRAEAVPTTDGARLELHAEDPQRVRDLRTHVAEHAKMMAAGRCPMMEQPRGEATGEGATP
ncbi:MAG: hypothetical protein ACOCV4_00420 [Myxococcota bacterium]